MRSCTRNAAGALMLDGPCVAGPCGQFSMVMPMLSNNLPQWFSNHPPIYDIHKSYLENAEQGPFFNGHIPKRILAPREKWIDFLGKKVSSRIGIPAGPLLNARWVALAAQLGYDVLTYKTIRSREHPSHPLPNMIYIDTHGMVTHQR